MTREDSKMHSKSILARVTAHPALSLRSRTSLDRSLDAVFILRVQTGAMSEPQTGAVPSGPAVETFDLVRHFQDFVAVDNLNLTVRRGSFFGFLGPNGAGKSTTIKMLTGLLAPTSGRIRVLGRDLSVTPLEVKRRIGVVPEDLNLFERLTGAEMLAFTGRMYGLQES